MRIKCEYCGGFIDDSEEICPHCGAANSNLKRQGDGVPRTIVELDAWYKAHNLPPKEVTRFFIGEDYRGPKAFGIFKDGSTGIVTVYKNKDDGSRAVRYSGKDEAYAVNELYMKLKEKIAEQKANNRNAAGRNTASRNSGNYKPRKGANWINVIIWAVVLSVILFIIVDEWNKPYNGYYSYGTNQYYFLDDDWYIYDNASNDWTYTSVDDELYDNYDTYYESSAYDNSYDTSDFSDTSYYDDWSSSSSSDSWDSDSSWSSSDSWGDSGGWDSDW